MCSDDSGIGILNSNLGVIYELSGQQPMVKAIISSHKRFQLSNVKNLTKKKMAQNLKKKAKGYPLQIFQYFGPEFFDGIFIF